MSRSDYLKAAKDIIAHRTLLREKKHQGKSTAADLLIDGYIDYVSSIRLWALLRIAILAFVFGLVLLRLYQVSSRWSSPYLFVGLDILVLYTVLERLIVRRKESIASRAIVEAEKADNEEPAERTVE